MPGPNDKPGPDCREAYSLRISPQGAEIRAKSSAGIFYGMQTLRQLVEGETDKSYLPEVDIQDWPSLAYRGVMMDLSHGPMPTEDEIKRQIDFLASWKAISTTSTPRQRSSSKAIRSSIRARATRRSRCEGSSITGGMRHVDVVPCMEFYGHLHDVFRLERYSRMSALPYGGEINPRREDVRVMLKDWVTQMAALFPSHWFHIGLR